MSPATPSPARFENWISPHTSVLGIAPGTFAAITRARRIIEFRNRLTHAYRAVDDALVWAIIEADVPVLRQECGERMKRFAPADEEG